MTACCQRKSRAAKAGELDALDRRRRQYVDPVVVDRAVRGQPIGRKINDSEFRAVVIAFSTRRRMGLKEITEATGMSRSQVALILQKERERQTRERRSR